MKQTPRIGSKNNDISGDGMKERMLSPNSSNRDTRRCPLFKSSFKPC